MPTRQRQGSMSQFLKSFGKALQVARERKDRTQEEVSEATGISLNRIQTYEQGRSEAPGAALALLIRDYDTTMDDLMRETYKTMNVNLTEEQEQLIEAVKNIPPD